MEVCACLTHDVGDDSISDYLPPHANMKENRTWTDVIYLIISIVLVVGWAGVAIHAILRGNPAKLINPSNSEGELCGYGSQAGKPNLLYFDLTQCAGLQAAVQGCPTPQVCVKECPRTYWNSAQGKSSDLVQFCNNLTSHQLEDTPISQLVAERVCPAYLLPSTPFQGRCVPIFGLVKREETGRAEAKMNAIKTKDSELLHIDNLLKGIEFVILSIDSRGYGEKMLSSYWWIVLTSFFIAFFFSLSWRVLIQLAATPVLWTSIVLCLTILVAGSVFSFMRYSQLGTVRDHIFLPPVISVMLLVYFFKQIKVAIKKIEEANKYISSVKSVLFIPIGQSILQVLLIFIFMIVSSFLASSGATEYRVVDSCSFETCINELTKKMFAMNDICNPRTFAECTGCPWAQCVYHKLVPSFLGYWLQAWNLWGTLWLLSFVESFGCMLMAGIFAGFYWRGGQTGDLLRVNLWTSVKRICRHHLGTLAFGSLVPFLWCINWPGYAFTAMNGDRFLVGRKQGFSFSSRISDTLLGLDGVTQLILFTAKLSIVLFVCAATFAIFSIQDINCLDFHLNYQIVPILIVILGSYVITSPFFSMYSIKKTYVLSSQLNKMLEINKNQNKIQLDSVSSEHNYNSEQNFILEIPSNFC